MSKQKEKRMGPIHGFVARRVFHKIAWLTAKKASPSNATKSEINAFAKTVECIGQAKDVIQYALVEGQDYSVKEMIRLVKIYLGVN